MPEGTFTFSVVRVFSRPTNTPTTPIRTQLVIVMSLIGNTTRITIPTPPRHVAEKVNYAAFALEHVWCCSLSGAHDDI